MKKLIFSLSLISISLLYFGQPVLAGDSATVVATVESEIISITASTSTLDYGLVLYGSSKDLPDVLTLTNSGNMAEDFEVTGSDATDKTGSGKVWTLNIGAPAENQFRHAVSLDGVGYIHFPKTSYAQVKMNVAAGATVPSMHTMIWAPTSGYSGTFETNIYFRAVKHV